MTTPNDDELSDWWALPVALLIAVLFFLGVPIGAAVFL